MTPTSTDLTRRTLLGGVGLWSAASALGHVVAPPPLARPLEVLHWWSSASERLALDRLTQTLNVPMPRWRNAVVPGGASAAATSVLRSRLLARDPPDMAHLSGGDVQDLAARRFLTDLAPGGERSSAWAQVFPFVRQAVEHADQVVAVPMGVHRINTLIYSLPMWQAHGLAEPRTWGDVMRAAQPLSREGIAPLVWSDEGSQLLVLFEGLLLSVLGAQRYGALLQRAGWEDPGVLQALDHLRHLRSLNASTKAEASPWSRAGRAFLMGRAGMWLGGDWSRAELNAWGLRAGVDYACTTMPGTENRFLYAVDCLGAFDKGREVQPLQQSLATRLLEPDVQQAYNRAKGSVPVRADVALGATLDPAERSTWQALRDDRVTKLAGLGQLWGMGGMRADTVATLLQDFVRNPEWPAQSAWLQLARLNREGLST